MMCSMMGSSFLLKVLALLSLVLLALMATGSTGATVAEVNRHSDDVAELVTPNVMCDVIKESIKMSEELKGYKLFYAYAKAFPKARPMPRRHPDFSFVSSTPRDVMLLRLAYAKLQSSTETTGTRFAG